jgi:hypothetical protein
MPSICRDVLDRKKHYAADLRALPIPEGKILKCLPELRRRVKVTKRGTGYLRPSAVSRILAQNIMPAMHSSIWEPKSKLLADFWTRKVRVNQTLRSKSIRRLP